MPRAHYSPHRSHRLTSLIVHLCSIRCANFSLLTQAVWAAPRDNRPHHTKKQTDTHTHTQTEAHSSNSIFMIQFPVPDSRSCFLFPGSCSRFPVPVPDSRFLFPIPGSCSRFPVPVPDSRFLFPIPGRFSRFPIQKLSIHSRFGSCSRFPVPVPDSRLLFPIPGSCSRFPVPVPDSRFLFPIPGSCSRFPVPVPDSRSLFPIPDPEIINTFKACNVKLSGQPPSSERRSLWSLKLASIVGQTMLKSVKTSRRDLYGMLKSSLQTFTNYLNSPI